METLIEIEPKRRVEGPGIEHSGARPQGSGGGVSEAGEGYLARSEFRVRSLAVLARRAKAREEETLGAWAVYRQEGRTEAQLESYKALLRVLVRTQGLMLALMERRAC